MKLGGLDALREALGGRGPAGELLVGKNYASALKQAAGMTDCRLFDVDAAVKWRKEHPTWRMTEIYPNRPRPYKQPNLKAAAADKCGAP